MLRKLITIVTSFVFIASTADAEGLQCFSNNKAETAYKISKIAEDAYKVEHCKKGNQLAKQDCTEVGEYTSYSSSTFNEVTWRLLGAGVGASLLGFALAMGFSFVIGPFAALILIGFLKVSDHSFNNKKVYEDLLKYIQTGATEVCVPMEYGDLIEPNQMGRMLDYSQEH